ncbi:MAG: site-specific integrase [Lachnospiraceae bacterium]|nr:site-specific integrase [Lachnospiraceae bacterium]
MLEKEAVEKVELNPRKKAFLFILFYCGLRRQEALALTPSCFDWDKKTLSVRKVLIFVGNSSEIKDYPKSDHGFRTIPMTDELIEKIRPYVESLDEDEYLFHAQNTVLMTQIGYRRMWESIVTALNVAVGYNPCAKKNRSEPPIQGLTAHIFRHNFCSELCYQVPEISTKMIAKLLGDDERMVLEVYSHIVAEKENVAESLSKAFKRLQ